MQKKYDEALECYNKSLELKEDPVLYSNRAAVLLKLNKFAEAEVDCSKAISLDYTYAKAYYRRGMARMELKMYTEAIQGVLLQNFLTR